MSVVNTYSWIRRMIGEKIGRSFMLVIALTVLMLQPVSAQEKSSSISDEIREIWENNTNGMFDQNTQLDLLVLENYISFQDDTYDTPIDGGLGFLLAAGAGYAAHGLNRKRKRRKKEQDEETATTDQ